MRTLLIAILAALSVPFLFAQPVAVNDTTNPADVESFLIPLAFGGTVPGAFGSQWSMEFRLRNDSDVAIPFKDRDPYGGCVPLCPLLVFPAHSSSTLPFSPIPPTATAQGALYYVPREYSPSIHLNLRIRDLSRALSTWGTEIPLIRGSSALTLGSSLFPVPTDSHFRATLRVYDFLPSAAGDSAVRVRLFSIATDVLIGETILNLHGTPLDPFPPRPGYAQITNFTDQFPGVVDTGAVRVEIQPLTPNLRYWAFVSVTNNETQHITTITPQ